MLEFEMTHAENYDWRLSGRVEMNVFMDWTI